MAARWNQSALNLHVSINELFVAEVLLITFIHKKQWNYLRVTVVTQCFLVLAHAFLTLVTRAGVLVVTILGCKLAFSGLAVAAIGGAGVFVIAGLGLVLTLAFNAGPNSAPV